MFVNHDCFFFNETWFRLKKGFLIHASYYVSRYKKWKLTFRLNTANLLSLADSI